MPLPRCSSENEPGASVCIRRISFGFREQAIPCERNTVKMSAPGGWNSRHRRGSRTKAAKNDQSPKEKCSSESANGALGAEERQNNRRCQNRRGLPRRRKGRSSPPENSNANCFVKPWRPSEGLRRWKEAGNLNCRYFFGSGCGQVLLERDVEEGFWKVSTDATPSI